MCVRRFQFGIWEMRRMGRKEGRKGAEAGKEIRTNTVKLGRV